jgi:hypothetical protein
LVTVSSLTEIKHHSIEIDPIRIAHFLLYRDLFVYAFVLGAWQGRGLEEREVRFKIRLEENLVRRRKKLGL